MYVCTTPRPVAPTHAHAHVRAHVFCAQEEFCTGRVLYHAYHTKSEAEQEQLQRKKQQREAEKARRKELQVRPGTAHVNVHVHVHVRVHVIVSCVMSSRHVSCCV